MNKKIVFLLAFALAMFAAVCTLIIFYPTTPKYKFSYEKEGVLFASDEASSAELMQELLSRKTFFVSFKASENSENSKAANNFLIPFLVVLIANDKNAVSLIQTVNSEGKLISCETNFGNPRVQETLSAEECKALLNSNEEEVKILLNSSNNSLQKSEIIFSSHGIELIPRDSDSVKNVSYALLSELFPDYDKIIQQTNWVTSMVTG